MFCFCTNEIKTLRPFVRTIYPSVLTKSKKGSSFCPYNFSFCTSQITNWFGFLFVKNLLLYQPNHKKVVFLSVQLFLLYQPKYKLVRLSVRKSFASVPTKSQNASTFCQYNLSFCTSQITNWFDCLSVNVFLLYQPNHRMVRLSGSRTFPFALTHLKMVRLSVRTIFLSVLTKSQNSSAFCRYNFSFCTNQITNCFDFLSLQFILLY